MLLLSDQVSSQDEFGKEMSGIRLIEWKVKKAGKLLRILYHFNKNGECFLSPNKDKNTCPCRFFSFLHPNGLLYNRWSSARAISFTVYLVFLFHETLSRKHNTFSISPFLFPKRKILIFWSQWSLATTLFVFLYTLH